MSYEQDKNHALHEIDMLRHRLINLLYEVDGLYVKVKAADVNVEVPSLDPVLVSMRAIEPALERYVLAQAQAIASYEVDKRGL